MKYIESFKFIKRELESNDKKREDLIQKAREIIKLSKIVIYSVHRLEMKEAIRNAKIMKAKVNRLPIGNFDTEIGKVAFQEYVEAECFLQFNINQKIPTQKALGVSTINYLLGLCDLSGELVRNAVNSVVRGDAKKALEIKEDVEELYGEFLKLNIRSSELRKKADSIRWNLRKLEDLSLNITIPNALNR